MVNQEVSTKLNDKLDSEISCSPSSIFDTESTILCADEYCYDIRFRTIYTNHKIRGFVELW